MTPKQGRPIHADDLKFLESTMTLKERWSWEGACHAQVDVEEVSEEKYGRDDFSTWSTTGVMPGLNIISSVRFVTSPEARSDACLHHAVTKLYSFYENTGQS